MTPVEWLFSEYTEKYIITTDIIEKALKMERQQIIDTYLSGINNNSKSEALNNVSRFEVINHSPNGEGREFVKRNITVDEFSLQDDGKTLKIFLK